MIRSSEFLRETRNILELVTGYSCNNNCAYCNVNKKRRLGDRPLSELKRILQKYRKERELLIITGGEPTMMFNGLLEIVRFASSPPVDYKCILLETNGRMFSQPNNASLMREALVGNSSDIRGAVSRMIFEVAICGSYPELHDSISRVPGSFKQTVAGISNLISVFGAENICAKVVVNALNYKDMKNMAQFIFGSLGVLNTEFVLSQIGQDVQNNMSVSYQKLGPHLKSLLGVTLKKNQKLYIDNVPLCLLKDEEEALSSHYYSQGHGQFFKRVDLDKINTRLDNKVACRHKKQCYNGLICDGIGQDYLNNFGYEGIVKCPVKLTNKHMLIEGIEKIKNVRADVISHFSGGVDSKTMSAVFAKKHSDMKMVLITYEVGIEKSNELARVSAKEIMAKHRNIIAHYILPIPRKMVERVLLYGLKKAEENDGTLRPCPLCGYLWLSASIYLHKKIFGGNVIIEGMRIIGEDLKKYHADERARFARRYGVKVMHPFLSLHDKNDVFRLAKKDGLSESGNQGVCFFKNSRVAREYNDLFLNKSLKKEANLEESYDHIETNARVRFFHGLLKTHGITFVN